MEIDYEALGRYTSAKEQADQFARERNDILRELKQVVDKVSDYGGSSGHLTGNLPIEQIETLWPKIKEANDNMVRAINAANQAAEKCGKAKMTLYT